MSKFNPQTDLDKYEEVILSFFQELSARATVTNREWQSMVRNLAKKTSIVFSKHDLQQTYQLLYQKNHPKLPKDSNLISKLQLKPIRTLSGVATVTVLTKPFPCPGQCIFCPNDVRMPKSYLADEPGAQRALQNHFDPYLQTYVRLQALSNIGHPVDKVEVIILGGTWSFYPENYQIWFVKRIFEALNDFSANRDQRATASKIAQMANWQTVRYVASVFRNSQSKPSYNHTQPYQASHFNYNQTVTTILQQHSQTSVSNYGQASWEELFAEHKKNETAKCRCVGLVVETRPDNISPAEVIRIRKLGCTKTQIGFQSLNDEVLAKNHRGHDVRATRRAVKLLRQAGLKIHAHWMANLYGSSVSQDILDYKTIFNDPDFRPDELKIYPCSLLETAELMDYYKQGLWQPYSHEELLQVVTECIANTPPYCRLTRIVRDIPSTNIVSGNKYTNFRQLAEQKLDQQGIPRQDIRSREIRDQTITRDQLKLDIISYQTSCGEEQFLQFITTDNKLAGFLRLHLPSEEACDHPFIPELSNSAIIREIHIYGQTVGLGRHDHGKAQHLGLGTSLIELATNIAKSKGYHKLAVISAIGTREYYRHRGFQDGQLYQFKIL